MNLRDTVMSALALAVIPASGVVSIVTNSWTWLGVGVTAAVLLWLLPVVLNVVAVRHPKVPPTAETRLPTPPQDVQLALPDGQRIPLDCHYEGVHDGIHQWRAIHPAGRPFGPGMEIQVGVLPGKTAIVFNEPGADQ